jgi:carboxyl-terminal processing protease
MSAEELKKKGIDDFQLDYALKTIARLASKPGAVVAQAAPAPAPTTRKPATH